MLQISPGRRSYGSPGLVMRNPRNSPQALAHNPANIRGKQSRNSPMKQRRADPGPNGHEEEEGQCRGEQHLGHPPGRSPPALPHLAPGVEPPMIGHMAEVVPDIISRPVKDADGRVQIDLVAIPPGPPLERGIRTVGPLEKRAVGLVGLTLE